jgi:hypothetical protein
LVANYIQKGIDVEFQRNGVLGMDLPFRREEDDIIKENKQ